MKRKRIIGVFFSLSIMLSSGVLSVSASDGTNAQAAFVIDENGVLTHYNGFGGEVVIPDGVTEIGTRAFFGDCITKITISSTVKSIDDDAFGGNSFTELVIPGNVKSIGVDAFEGCDQLKSVKLEEGVETLKSNDDEGTFFLCPNLEEISFPSTMKCITGCASCVRLEKVTIPEGVTKIDNYAFKGCGLKSLKLPSTVKEIGKEAFYSCNQLSSVELGDGVETIGSRAFSWCDSLESINITSSVKTISTEDGDSPFYNDDNLKSITVDSENKNYCSIDNVLYSKDKEYYISIRSQRTIPTSPYPTA